MTLVLNRYPMVFRASIVTEVMTVTQHGDSLCLVGLAGVGKSNLAHFLEVPEVVHHYLPSSAAKRTHFRRLALSAETEIGQVYSGMAAQIHHVAEQVGVDLPPEYSSEVTLAQLRALLNELCGRQNQRIVFVFDEFEAQLSTLPPHFLADLRSLRDEHRTSRNVVFLLITHRMPQLIRRHPLIQRGGKFFELIERHIYALTPYIEADSLSMIDALTQRRNPDGVILGEDKRAMLHHLSGGHSKLLAELYVEMQPSFSKSVHRLQEAIRRPCPLRSVCDHIWDHLHEEEMNALIALVNGQAVDPVMVEFLRKRGLVRIESTPALFSPLFAAYVRSLT